MKQWIQYSLLGAIGFWIPGVILTAILRRELGLTLFTVLPITGLFFAYWFASKSRNRTAASPSIAACMLLGIYVLGSWVAMLENTFLGSGFHGMSRQDLWFLALCFLPPITWLMAGEQLFALLFVTIFSIFAHLRWERGRWIPLYSWHKRTKLSASPL
jgi:hypothetical protein